MLGYEQAAVPNGSGKACDRSGRIFLQPALRVMEAIW